MWDIHNDLFKSPEFLYVLPNTLFKIVDLRVFSCKFRKEKQFDVKYSSDVINHEPLMWSMISILFFFFFVSWFSFTSIHESQECRGRGEGISLIAQYQFRLLHRHLDSYWAIPAKRSLLHIASSRTRTRNLWFPLLTTKLRALKKFLN